MLERPAEGERCLQRSQDLLRRDSETDDYLYVLNILALNRLKMGDWQGALSIENRIRSALERLPSGRWQITYINSLNLARLYRRRDNLEAAEQCYLEAFSTSFGAWSDSDLLYLNVCQARLYEARTDYREALHSWIRAALYWVSSPVPEGISERVIGAVIGSPPVSARCTIDEVSVALIARLQANAEAAHLAPDIVGCHAAENVNIPSIVRSGCIPATHAIPLWHALGADGFWVFGMAGCIPPVVNSNPNRRLRAILAALLTGSQPDGTGRVDTIVVDDGMGCGLPETEAELLAACVRHGVQSLIFKGRPVSLSGEQLSARLHARLASTVSRVFEAGDGVVVAFKRYLKPRPFNGRAAAIVRAFSKAESWDLSSLYRETGANDDLPLLRTMEKQRVIDLFLPEETLVSEVAAGRLE
jgi:tetratricopeptide (TPR) repeat protein